MYCSIEDAWGSDFNNDRKSIDSSKTEEFVDKEFVSTLVWRHRRALEVMKFCNQISERLHVLIGAANQKQVITEQYSYQIAVTDNELCPFAIDDHKFR